MYGNVGAALRWMNTFTDLVTQNLNMKQSKADPCLFIRENTDGTPILLVVVYVDDVLVTGPLDLVNEFKHKVHNYYAITDLGLLRKHCGVWYTWHMDELGTTYLQANMTAFAQQLVMDYETDFGHVKEMPTPGYPNFHLISNDEDPMDIGKYRSFLGRIMYYLSLIHI